MKKLRWQLIVVVLALGAIGLLLISQQQGSISGVDLADQPTTGGIYAEALVGSFGRLNPVLDYYNPADYDVDRLIYSSLVRFDARGLPYGDLAETWGISQDVKVYNFSIRADAAWHDGQPLTSDDIIYTVELLRSEDLPLPQDLREFWQQVEVLALDEKTIQFRLPEPFSPFLDYLTFGVLPKHLLGKLSPAEVVNAGFNLAPVGSGPYRFEGLDVQDDRIRAVVLVANENYYGRKPFIEKMIFRYYPDEQAALAAYRAGEVLGINQVGPATLPEALKEEKLGLFTGRAPRLAMVYLNLDDPQLPFFQDANVRRGLMMSLNRRWIIDRLLGGQAMLANGPIFPENWAHYDGVPQIEYDPDAAVELFKKAEFTIPAEGGNVRARENVKLAFQLAYPDGELYKQIAERIQQDWANVGVQVGLKAVPYEELVLDYLEPRSYQAALVELDFTRSPDPDPYPFWHQAQITSGQNYAQWDDRQVSEYLEQARVLSDVTERQRRYRNFQIRFAAELPALPLFYPVYSYAVDGSVRGVSMGPLYDPSDRFNNVTGWYLRTSSIASAADPTPTP
ncbi:MAG: peptide ABC transporter substrate-binding protein [Chloroflexota bacterium]